VVARIANRASQQKLPVWIEAWQEYQRSTLDNDVSSTAPTLHFQQVVKVR